MYEYKARITSIYDGDTVTAEVDLGFNVRVIEKIRLARINTPEIRGEERPQGLISRDRLRQLMLNQEVMLHTIKDKKGKYQDYKVVRNQDNQLKCNCLAFQCGRTKICKHIQNIKDHLHI